MTKTHVAMGACPICGESNGVILLDKRLQERFDERELVPTPDPCEKCRSEHLGPGKGVMLVSEIGVTVLRVDAFERLFEQPAPEEYVALVDTSIMEKLMQRYQEVEHGS